jgi:lysophospholipase L1-like esterase
MAVLLVLAGIIAALVGGAVGALTLGQTAGVAIALLALVLTIAALSVARALAKLVLALLVAVIVAAVAFGGLGFAQVLAAVRNTTGPADAPDPVALAAANQKLDAAENQGGFRVQLTEAEIQAVLQEALAAADASPVRRIDLEVVDGPTPETGVLGFRATFKGGDLGASGRIGARLDEGAIALDIQEVTLGRFSAPGLARGAVEDLIRAVVDINDRLAEQKASLQSLTIGRGQVVAVGTQADGPILTSDDLLGALSENARSIANAAAPPAERLGPGEVTGLAKDGSRYYVALGDSLAANVGVASASAGYVSRLHKQLQARDSAQYGLRNFGVSGETSASLIRTGQLEGALDFIRANQVAYITVDIGANDLLGHLGSEDCEQDLRNPPCQERLTTTLAAYRPNLNRILGDLRGAARDARIIFLGTYNPFSLGFGAQVGLESATDDAAKQLNDVAREVSRAHNVLFADGQAPMQRTAAATTGMLQQPPDIHPNGAGYDILAAALLEAIR